MSAIKRALGHICDNCPFCNWARNHPDTTIGKMMEWHGKWCPAWKEQKVIAEEREKAENTSAS